MVTIKEGQFVTVEALLHLADEIDHARNLLADWHTVGISDDDFEHIEDLFLECEETVDAWLDGQSDFKHPHSLARIVNFNREVS